MHIITMRLPLPPLAVSPNAGARDQRTRNVERQRWSAELVLEIENAIRSAREPLRVRFPLERIQLRLAAHVKRRAPRDGSYRPTDPDNLVAACKGLIDALTEPKGVPGMRGYRPGVGIIEDDTAEHLELQAEIVPVENVMQEGLWIAISTPESG